MEERILNILIDIKADIGGLKKGQDELKEDVAFLKEGQKRLEERVIGLEDDMSEVKSTVNILDVSVCPHTETISARELTEISTSRISKKADQNGLPFLFWENF